MHFKRNLSYQWDVQIQIAANSTILGRLARFTTYLAESGYKIISEDSGLHERAGRYEFISASLLSGYLTKV